MSLSSHDLGQWIRPLARAVENRTPRLWSALRRLHYDLRLLLGGKLVLFLGLDALILLNALFEALASGAEMNEMYRRVTVIPTLLLGVPALAGVVALERRSGSLDLALAVPSTERYFLRRASAVVGLLGAQALVVLVLTWIESSGGAARAVSELGVLSRALVQTVLVLALLPAVVLFWSVRVRSAGAVMVSCAATFAVLLRWAARPPDPERSVATFAGLPISLWTWTLDAAVLAAAVAIFGLYARVRLRRPETLLQ